MAFLSIIPNSVRSIVDPKQNLHCYIHPFENDLDNATILSSCKLTVRGELAMNNETYVTRKKDVAISPVVPFNSIQARLQTRPFGTQNQSDPNTTQDQTADLAKFADRSNLHSLIDLSTSSRFQQQENNGKSHNISQEQSAVNLVQRQEFRTAQLQRMMFGGVQRRSDHGNMEITPNIVQRHEQKLPNQLRLKREGMNTSNSVQLLQRTPESLIIQRELDQSRLDRLSNGLGKRKYSKVIGTGLEEYFDTLSDTELVRYKSLQNTKFDQIIEGLKESSLSTITEGVSNFAQILDLVGSAVETGEDAAEIAAMLPSLLGTASKVVSVGADSGMESFGGGIGGIKDTYEGGSSIAKQSKYVEGGMTLLSGLSGIASLIPGVPDAVGVAGASAKSLGGVTKMANTKINRNAISKLKSDASSNTQLIAALEILDNSIGYWEGAQQTVLGGVEGVGSMFGGVGKWGTSLFSKGVETLPSWGMYAGRAIGSTITSSIDSNAQVKKREEQEKSTQKAAMRAAVNSSVGKPEHIGRLHRLAVLIEPDFAEEMNRAINLLDDSTQLAVKDAIKEKNTWNPS
jgi:hypothetical protein